MIRRFIVMSLLVLLAAPALAQNPDSQYVRIYNLMQQADSLKAEGKDAEALPKYLEAKTGLSQIRRIYPEWQTNVVSFRLRYLSEKIDSLSKSAPPPTAGLSSTGGNGKAGANSNPADNLRHQLEFLQREKQQLQAQNQVLEAKLKEALSTQPAAVDPREFNKAQERIQALLKENELLKAGLEEEKQRPAAIQLEQARAELLNANNQLKNRQSENQKLTAEKTALQTQLGTAEAVRAENKMLKQQLASTTERNAAAAVRMAALQSEVEVLRLERSALEARLKDAVAQPKPNDAESSQREMIKTLVSERDTYLQQLEVANQELAALKKGDLAQKVIAMSRELDDLRDRIEVYEAKAVPYTAEELAFFDASTNGSCVPATTNPMATNAPADLATWLSAAQQSLASGNLETASKGFEQVLAQDNANPEARMGLAAIQVEEKQLDEAEQNLTAALAARPNDPQGVALLGEVKFRQGKYDDAISILIRAAKLNPKDADVQNLLGVTLSQKGLRGPAEQAFRRAIVLSGNHAGAHQNLAVFYAAENPPNIPLARFHYERALALGHPKNLELEKLFATREKLAQGK